MIPISRRSEGDRRRIILNLSRDGEFAERCIMAQTGILLAAGTNEMEILEYYLDEALPDGEIYRGSYGINVAKVVEIIREPKATPLPMAPPGMLGMFISRGKTIPLLDLAVLLGKKKPENEINPLAIVTQFSGTTSAFVVSAVNRIHRLAWGQIEPAGTIYTDFDNSITGIAKVGDCNILLVDMEKIVTELTPAAALETGEDAVAPADAGVRRSRVLIVDDSSSLRNILSSQLEKAGFLVEKANDGSEGWKKLQELKTKSLSEKRPIDQYVDIVISDIEMPQMDGYSLCQYIKQDPVLKALPVILFSSLINQKLLHKGASVGADDQITKPESANLAKKAKELVERYAKERGRNR